MNTGDRQAVRLLKFMQNVGGACKVADANKGRVELSGGQSSRVFERTRLDELYRCGLIKRQGDCLFLEDAGVRHLRRLLHPEQRLAPQKRELNANAPGRAQMSGAAAAETPLLRLVQRRDRHGRTWISLAQFEAGERLRSDFERANIVPSVTSNLSGAVGCRVSGGGPAAHDIPDFAIDARRRVDAALTSLQRGLAEVAFDVCCHLKGLEQIERQNRWPPRSAKLMLRTALEGLAVHYGLAGQSSRRGGSIVHWGADGYRPSIR